MSRYLSRLSMRTQIARQSQVLQPFVRSTSPVADRDQRIGMAGFEEIQFGVAPHAELNSDLAPDRLDSDVGVQADEAAPVSMPLRIRAANNSAPATVQRKIANSTADLTPPTSAKSATSAANIAAASTHPAMETTIIQPSVSSSSRPEQFIGALGTPPNLSESGNWGQAVTESSRLSRSAEREESPSSSQMDQPLYFPQPQSFLGQTPETPEVSATVETHNPEILDGSVIASGNHNTKLASPSAVPTADSLAAIPDSGTFLSRNTAQLAERNKLPPRLVELAQPADTPSLEPSTRTLANASESSFEMTPFSRGTQRVSPQVVIGRINVEVIPPSASAQPAETSSSQPLTAASVSVIGSLGGRMQSNVRFSLRQR